MSSSKSSSSRTLYFGSISISSAEDTLVPLQDYDLNGGSSFSGRNEPDALELNIVSYLYRSQALGSRIPKITISGSGISPTSTVEFGLALRLTDTSFSASESDVAGNIITIPIARGRGLPPALLFSMADSGVLLPEYKDASATVKNSAVDLYRMTLPDSPPTATIPISYPWYNTGREPPTLSVYMDGFPASWFVVGVGALGTGFPTMTAGGLARIVSWVGTWTDELLYGGGSYTMLYYEATGGSVKRYSRLAFTVCSPAPITYDVSLPTLPPQCNQAWLEGRMNVRSIRVLPSEDLPTLNAIVPSPTATGVFPTFIYPLRSGVAGTMELTLMINGIDSSD